MISTGRLKWGEKVMYEWHRYIQTIVDEIDRCIKNGNSEALTLTFLARRLGYSEFHTTRRFREISGMQFRDYLRRRRLAFALLAVRDSQRSILDIALDHGFSSHAAFTRAFKDAYGMTPSEYRKSPKPVVLRTKINPFDRYFLGLGEIGRLSQLRCKGLLCNHPAHKFLHIKNYESHGYWISGKSRVRFRVRTYTIRPSDSIKGKLDDQGGSGPTAAMDSAGYISDPKGWGVGLSSLMLRRCGATRLPGSCQSRWRLWMFPKVSTLCSYGPLDYYTENSAVVRR